MSVKRSTLLCGFLIVAIVAGYVLTIRPGQAWYGDFALYVGHARNIAEGRPYADTGYVRNPNYPQLSPQNYPPVFPLLLAPVYGLFGLDYTALKVVVIVSFGLALGVIAYGLRDRLGPGERLALLALLGLNPGFWLFTDNIVSDLPFLCFTYLGLGLIHTARAGNPRSPRVAVGLGAAAGVAMYLAYGTRSIGLILIPCVLLHAWWRQRRLDAPTAAAILPLAFGAVIQNLSLGSASQYLESMMVYTVRPSAALTFIGGNLSAWAKALAGLCDNGYFAPAAWLVAVVVLALAVTGYVIAVRQRRSVFELFTALYLLGVLPWPMANDPRFLYPVVPLGLVYAFEGWQWLSAKLPARPRRPVALAMLTAVLLSYALRYTSPGLLPTGANVLDDEAQALFRFVQDKTEPTDLLVCAKPRIMALYTRRRCIAATLTRDDEVMLDFLRANQPSHLILIAWWPFDERLVRPYVDRHRNLFQMIYETPAYLVLRTQLPAEPSEPSVVSAAPSAVLAATGSAASPR